MSLKLAKKLVVLFQGDSITKENKYIELLEKEGIKARIIPTLSFHFINKEILQKCLYKYDSYSGMIFTSTRAVTAVSLSFLKLDESCIEQWKKKKIFSVGKATAESALSVLHLDTYGSDTGNSENLCEFIIKMCDQMDKPLLFPCSNIRKDTIPSMLSQKNIPVEEIVCYETVPNQHLENLWQNLISEEGIPELLIFFSPSGVQYSVDIIKNIYQNFASSQFIAIGPSTAKALSEVDVPCKVTEKPTPECVVHIVKQLLSI